MLRTESFRDLAVVDIAREAGVSAATFYQYFPDVETAIFLIADHVADDGCRRLTALVEMLEAARDLDAARGLARGMLDLWRDYEPVLRILDLGAAERDERFQERRDQLLAEPTSALVRVLAAQSAAGSPAGDPEGTASVLMAMLSQVAANRRDLRDRGIDRDRLVEVMAELVLSSLTASGPRTRS